MNTIISQAVVHSLNLLSSVLLTNENRQPYVWTVCVSVIFIKSDVLMFIV